MTETQSETQSRRPPLTPFPFGPCANPIIQIKEDPAGPNFNADASRMRPSTIATFEPGELIETDVFPRYGIRGHILAPMGGRLYKVHLDDGRDMSIWANEMTHWPREPEQKPFYWLHDNC